MMDPAGIDYVVKLPSGETRVMSHDKLRASYAAGTIHAASPVLAPHAIAWTTIGTLFAESDDALRSKSPPSLAPTAIDTHARPSVVARRWRTKRIGIAFAAVAVLAGAIAIKSGVTQARADHAPAAAQPAAPPPPAAAPLPTPPAFADIESDPPEPAPPATAPAPAKDTKKTKLPGMPARKRKK